MHEPRAHLFLLVGGFFLKEKNRMSLQAKRGHSAPLHQGTEGHLVKEDLTTGTYETHMSSLCGGPEGCAGHPERWFMPAVRARYVPLSPTAICPLTVVPCE